MPQRALHRRGWLCATFDRDRLAWLPQRLCRKVQSSISVVVFHVLLSYTDTLDLRSETLVDRGPHHTASRRVPVERATRHGREGRLSLPLQKVLRSSLERCARRHWDIRRRPCAGWRSSRGWRSCGGWTLLHLPLHPIFAVLVGGCVVRCPVPLPCADSIIIDRGPLVSHSQLHAAPSVPLFFIVAVAAWPANNVRLRLLLRALASVERNHRSTQRSRLGPAREVRHCF